MNQNVAITARQNPPRAGLIKACCCAGLLLSVSWPMWAQYSPGTVLSWGTLGSPYAVTNAIAISTKSGGYLGPHGLALLSSGSVTAWGNNYFGECNVPADLTNAVSVAAGAMHSVAARSNGTVVCWGRNYAGESSPPPGLSNVIAVSAGYIFSMALLGDGTVQAWGNFGVPAGLSNVVAIASGVDHSLALKSDGTVVAWGGMNQWGQTSVPADLTNVSAIAAGRMYSLALKADSTVVAWGNLGVGPPNNLSNILSCAAGMNFGLAIRSDHSLLGWGYNFNGELNFPPQQTNLTVVAAGDDVSMALTLQPVIFTQPASFSVSAGTDKSLTVDAAGSSALSYQWLKNGTNIVGATGVSLFFHDLQSQDAGSYLVSISNQGGSITSSLASVTVNPSAPVIVTNLFSQSVLAGTNVTFQVAAIGSEPLAFQWSRNGVPIPGAVQPQLTLTNVTDSNEGTYQVSISNNYGTNNSSAVSLSVNYPPTVLNALLNLTLPAGTNLILRAMASGDQPLAYQWRLQGQNIPGATYPTLVLGNIQSSNAGPYSIVVSNAFGVVTNVIYNLTVVDSPPIIFVQPASQVFQPGNTVVLRALAYGTAPLWGQWWRNGSAVLSATNTTLVLTNIQSADAGDYFLTLSNAFGFTNSAIATLSVGDPYPGQVDWPLLSFTQVGTNQFNAPTCITHARDGSGRLFVLEQKGQVSVIQGTNVLAQPFLAISNRVLSTGSEQGLLGIAFAPGFSTNRHFYVDYTRQPDGATVVSRFSLTSDPNIADTNSEQILKVIAQPFANNNGGQLAFGPDGYLYIGMGDGGGYSFIGDPNTNAQNTASLLGKILRIDVESGAVPYSIPFNNPFIGNSNAAPEIWDLGLRNPWRFSFDRQTGDLYIGDVGQNSYEEVDFQAANSPGGLNFGWRIREGPAPYAQPPGFDISALTDPVAYYSHSLGASVIGGYVYRGPTEPRMNGSYFFGDYVSGRIWALKQTGTNWQQFQVALSGYNISTFGEDEQGQLYLANYSDGRIYRVQDTHVVLNPMFVPAGGTIFSNTVTVLCSTPGATIHYTSDGRDPTEFDPGTSSGGVIPIDGAITKLRAFRSDLTPSLVVSSTFTFKVGPLSFIPTQGPITNGTPISVSTVTPGATIRYTLDGTTPDTNATVYTGPITLNGNTTLTAKAFRAGFTDSDVQQQYFALVTVATPLFNPAAGPITNGTIINISCATPQAVIHYTLDGSAPSTNSSIYTGPLTINGDTTLRAQAFANGYMDSSVQSIYYALVQVAAPAFSPASGPLTNGANISISCTTPGATIYYTLDGSTPTTNSSVATGPIVFSGPVTLTARAYGPQFDPSAAPSTFFGLIDYLNTVVTTVAGSTVPGFTNGVGLAARFSSPQGICIDKAGNLYIADSGNNVIRKILPSGQVSTFAGTGVNGSQIGFATNAQFSGPTGVCLDSAGNVYVADSGNCNRICKIDTNGVVTVFANVTSCGPGIGNFAPGLWQMSTGPDGNVYVGYWASLRKILPNGTVVGMAGTGCNCPGGWGLNVGPGIDADTNVYSATGGYLWKTAPDTSTELFSGGIGSFSDGPRLLAGFYNLEDAEVDSSGNIVLSDTTRVRKINSAGVVRTLAGTGVSGYKDGKGLEAQFGSAAGLCQDTNGNIYVADAANNCIRKIWADIYGPYSDFLITGITIQTNGILLNWKTVSTLYQFVQRAQSLSNGVIWQDIFTNPPSASPGSFLDSSTNRVNYYRVRLGSQ